MSSISNILLEQEILLESGTNELEILVFRLGDYSFGINVAKVREVLPRGPITRLPKAHDSILGVFRLREGVVPVVSLRRHLQVPDGPPGTDQVLILADFNQQQTAFVVDAVERIHRLSWERILAVPAISSLAHSPVTAVARIEERLVIMLDFEMVADQVTEQFYRSKAVDNPHHLPRGDLHILLADDSPTVREVVHNTLAASGYTRLMMFENGRLAWDWLAAAAERATDIRAIADLLISDVEMPQIDGLHLTKRIKEHPLLRDLPVLLYSSIVTPDNFKKGRAVGADAQISKPELAKVVEIADGLIAGNLIARDHAPEPAPASAPPPTLQRWIGAPAADLSPQWDVDDDDAAPSEGDPRVWQTFRAELADRTRHLQRLLGRCGDVPGIETLQELRRTLHTIKSAASVVPVQALQRATHEMENQLAAGWPHDLLNRYVAWLGQITAAGENLGEVLARAPALFAAS